MRNRNIGALQRAFEQTYNRPVSKKAPVSSIVSAFTGWQAKYRLKNGYFGYQEEVREWDRNIYNWAEQFVFLAPRLAKNVAKLGTEFIWILADEALSGLAINFKNRALSYKIGAQVSKIERMQATPNFHNTYRVDPRDQVVAPISLGTQAKIFICYVIGYLIQALSLIPWLLAKVGQSITSPFAAMKQTYAYFAKDENGSKRGIGYRILGTFAAGLRGLVTVGAYAAIAAFAAPLLIAPLAASGSLGSSIVAGVTTAVNWVAGLPIISTVGSIFLTGVATVGSTLGLSLSSSFAAAAVVAGATILATPVLAAAKVLLRWLSPFPPKGPERVSFDVYGDEDASIAAPQAQPRQQTRRAPQPQPQPRQQQQRKPVPVNSTSLATSLARSPLAFMPTPVEGTSKQTTVAAEKIHHTRAGYPTTAVKLS